MRCLILVSVAILGLAACGNSEEECRPICEWWHEYCSGETLESCMDDCQAADEAADDVHARCVDGEGWSTPSNCVSASCCVRFTYSDYSYEQYCL